MVVFFGCLMRVVFPQIILFLGTKIEISTKVVKIKCYNYRSHSYCPKEDHSELLSIWINGRTPVNNSTTPNDYHWQAPPSHVLDRIS
jgi:hypothetical protein